MPIRFFFSFTLEDNLKGPFYCGNITEGSRRGVDGWIGNAVGKLTVDFYLV